MGFMFSTWLSSYLSVGLGVIFAVGWWVQAVALATRHEHLAVSARDL